MSEDNDEEVEESDQDLLQVDRMHQVIGEIFGTIVVTEGEQDDQFALETGQHLYLGLILLSALGGLSTSEMPSENLKTVVKIIGDLCGKKMEEIANLPLIRIQELANIVIAKTLAAASELLEQTIGNTEGIAMFPISKNTPTAA